MHYYIDGYNLLFRMSKAGEDLQKQRKQLIEDLYEKVHFLKMDVTLVFDSQFQMDEITRFFKKNLEIIFTNYGETADTCIISLLKSELDPNQHTIVTSDKLLAWKARSRGAKTQTVEKFVQHLRNRYDNRKKHLKEPQLSLEQQIVQKIQTLSLPKETPRANPEDSLDYYLYHFEKKMVEEIGEKEVRKIEATRKVKKTKSHKFSKDEGCHKEEDKIETDLERWERLFKKLLKES